jgi:hypothetical protein
MNLLILSAGYCNENSNGNQDLEMTCRQQGNGQGRQGPSIPPGWDWLCDPDVLDLDTATVTLQLIEVCIIMR